jgi:hypothetical protein
MAIKMILSRLLVVAAAATAAAFSFIGAHDLSAQAASERTRRTYNAIQNLQNRQPTPYYSGQTNPYYGTPPQGTAAPPRAPANTTIQNRIRQIDRHRRNGQ